MAFDIEHLKNSEGCLKSAKGKSEEGKQEKVQTTTWKFVQKDVSRE